MNERFGHKTRLVFVVGPTASGKSEFAVHLAESLTAHGQRTEIINADSVQFYAELEIGAAKPERELCARVPHHLLGHVALGANYTAGDFRRAALEIIKRRSEELAVQIFLVVGGSGFYLQALERGMFEVPSVDVPLRERLESELGERGLAWLYSELQTRDALAAEKIKPQDKYRILRALEILRSDRAGRTLTEIKSQFQTLSAESEFSVFKIGLRWTRTALRERIERRTKSMLARGLIAETEKLRQAGYAAWPPLSSVGYLQVQEFLDGKILHADLEPLIVTRTMQLAKRQMTWFKRDQSIVWYEAAEGLDLIDVERRLCGDKMTASKVGSE